MSQMSTAEMSRATTTAPMVVTTPRPRGVVEAPLGVDGEGHQVAAGGRQVAHGYAPRRLSRS